MTLRKEILTYAEAETVKTVGAILSLLNDKNMMDSIRNVQTVLSILKEELKEATDAFARAEIKKDLRQGIESRKRQVGKI